jgi:hypothetical protein
MRLFKLLCHQLDYVGMYPEKKTKLAWHSGYEGICALHTLRGALVGIVSLFF